MTRHAGKSYAPLLPRSASSTHGPPPPAGRPGEGGGRDSSGCAGGDGIRGYSARGGGNHRLQSRPFTPERYRALVTIRCRRLHGTEGWVRNHNGGCAPRYEGYEALASGDAGWLRKPSAVSIAKARVHRLACRDGGWRCGGGGRPGMAFAACRAHRRAEARVPIWKKKPAERSGRINCGSF